MEEIYSKLFPFKSKKITLEKKNELENLLINLSKKTQAILLNQVVLQAYDTDSFDKSCIVDFATQTLISSEAFKNFLNNLENTLTLEETLVLKKSLKNLMNDASTVAKTSINFFFFASASYYNELKKSMKELKLILEECTSIVTDIEKIIEIKE